MPVSSRLPAPYFVALFGPMIGWDLLAVFFRGVIEDA